MKQSQSIRIVLLFLLLGVAGNATNYAAQGRGQQKDKADKKERGKPDTPPGQDKHEDKVEKSLPPGQVKKEARLSQARQQQLINEQRQRVVVYRQRLEQQQLLAQQYSALLQQQKRAASYRFQQQYLERLRLQKLALQRSYDYTNDPYFYTAPTYRYARGGTTYETNQYGANTLREAVNFGYSEGFGSGAADRQDRWASGYQNSYPYQDANYGYDGYYEDQAGYNYYFRQGFSRGYEDGYNSRSQYGTNTNGTSSVLGNIVSAILNLQSLR